MILRPVEGNLASKSVSLNTVPFYNTLKSRKLTLSFLKTASLLLFTLFPADYY